MAEHTKSNDVISDDFVVPPNFSVVSPSRDNQFHQTGFQPPETSENGDVWRPQPGPTSFNSKGFYRVPSSQTDNLTSLLEQVKELPNKAGYLKLEQKGEDDDWSVVSWIFGRFETTTILDQKAKQVKVEVKYHVPFGESVDMAQCKGTIQTSSSGSENNILSIKFRVGETVVEFILKLNDNGRIIASLETQRKDGTTKEVTNQEKAEVELFHM